MLPEGDESPLQTGSPMCHLSQQSVTLGISVKMCSLLLLESGDSITHSKTFKGLKVDLNQQHFPT